MSLAMAGDVDTSFITFGSTFNNDPKTFKVSFVGAYQLNYDNRGWLRSEPELSGIGPTTVKLDNNHLNAHICMNIKHPRLLMRFSCGKPMNSCPRVTCEEYLKTL